MKTRWSLKQSLLFIFFSTILISGPAWGTWLIYRKFFDFRSSNPKYIISAILQTGPEKEALKTSYLAELLDLSVDKPKNIYQLNLKEEQEKLISFPVIHSAIVKRIPPSTVYVDYSMRNPYCYLCELSNTAIDQEGVIFPCKPFYPPKKLPEIYLGLQEKPVWGKKIEDKRLQLAFAVLKHLKSYSQEVVRIDVADAMAESLGKQQVIVTLQEGKKTIYLRIPSVDYAIKLNSFPMLYTKYIKNRHETEVIVDARLFPIIFIS